MIKVWRAEEVATRDESDLLLHDLILAVNRVANIAGTYGYDRSTWNKQALRSIELLPSEFPATRTDHAVLQSPVELLAERINADLCYLDPPYTKRQYAGNYHVLETRRL